MNTVIAARVRSRVGYGVLLTLALSALSCTESPSAGTDVVAMQIDIPLQEDTIDALHATPLSVRLMARGRPVANTAIHMSVQGPSLVGPDLSQLSDVAVVSTDRSGFAQVFVLNGYLAGTERVEVSAPALSFTDTIEFTILPGAATHLVAAPSDTSAYVDTSVEVRGETRDRRGNARADAVTYQSTATLLEMDQDGAGTTNAIGRASVIVRAGTLADTAWVSVVPKARLIVLHRSSPGVEPGSGWYVIMTDGTIVEKLIGLAALSPAEVAGTLSPDGSSFVFHEGGSTNAFMWDYRFATKAMSQFQPGIGIGAAWPEFTRDGAWVVFSRIDGGIYRVRRTGGSDERLPTGNPGYDLDMTPSSSPDGERIVYASTRGAFPSPHLRVIDLSTSEIRSLDVEGYSPRWSPNSELIAFPAHELKVIHADGTGLRVLTPPGSNYLPGVTWSSDGAWIVATSASTTHVRGLHMVSPDGAHILPLHPGSLSPHQPVWMGMDE